MVSAGGGTADGATLLATTEAEGAAGAGAWAFGET